MSRLTAERSVPILERAVPSFRAVVDFREAHKTEHDLAALLSLQVAAYAAGRHTFREMEDLASDASPAALRILGVSAVPSDTTLYQLDRGLNPSGLREALWEQVRRELDRRAIENDLFPGGVLTFDGKGAGSGMGEVPNAKCRQSVCDAAGTEYWDLFAMRAVLTSSSARPCLDQELIDSKSGEATIFPTMLRRVLEPFPKLFRYITTDAGITSASNAKEVLAAHKLYVFAIKGNFKVLFPLATGLLSDSPVVASTEDRAHGSRVRRELRRVSVPHGVTFPGAQQFWGVRQVRTHRTGQVDTENRIFMTAVPWDELLADQMLLLVRLHWGIENGCNWTEDMVFDEDTGSPCMTGNGAVVLSWLRLLAYNAVAVLRAQLPRKDRQPQRWERARELVYQAMLLA